MFKSFSSPSGWSRGSRYCSLSRFQVWQSRRKCCTVSSVVWQLGQIGLSNPGTFWRCRKACRPIFWVFSCISIELAALALSLYSSRVFGVIEEFRLYKSLPLSPVCHLCLQIFIDDFSRAFLSFFWSLFRLSRPIDIGCWFLRYFSCSWVVLRGIGLLGAFLWSSVFARW